MTIKELKDKLNNYDDDTDVYIMNEFGIDVIEYVYLDEVGDLIIE